MNLGTVDRVEDGKVYITPDTWAPGIWAGCEFLPIKIGEVETAIWRINLEERWFTTIHQYLYPNDMIGLEVRSARAEFLELPPPMVQNVTLGYFEYRTGYNLRILDREDRVHSFALPDSELWKLRAALDMEVPMKTHEKVLLLLGATAAIFLGCAFVANLLWGPG